MSKNSKVEEKTIALQPKEGPTKTRIISEEIAKMALTLKDMIESTEEPKDPSKPVPLPTISVKILDKIIDYLNYHFDDPIEEKDSDEEDNNDIKRSDDISEWDRKFIDCLDRETLFDLILSANFLHVKGLVDLGCKTAANQIKGKSAEEVRKLWNIECDLTPKEEEELRLENAWAEDN